MALSLKWLSVRDKCSRLGYETVLIGIYCSTCGNNLLHPSKYPQTTVSIKQLMKTALYPRRL